MASKGSDASAFADQARLDRLRDLDLEPGRRLPEFDELARLAALVAGVPTAYVNIVDSDAVWSLGQFPVESPDNTALVWPRPATLCARLLGEQDSWVITDVLADTRTAGWMQAGEDPLGFRFYAGAPLLDSDGSVLGTVCVLGPEPRGLDPVEQTALEAVRNQTWRLLAARRERVQLQRQQQALAERQDAFEQAMEIAGETFWDWNLVTNEMGHARNRARMLGYDPDDVKASLDGWVDLSHPDDREPVAQRIRAHLTGKTPEYEAEYRQRHREGHWIWVRSRGRVVARDPTTGKPLRMRGTVVDITPRKELEARIAQMNEDLLQLVRSLPDAVLHKDVTGHWLFANAAARRLFGLAEHEPPDEFDRDAWLKGAVQTRLETHAVEGRAREYEVQRVPIHHASGEPKALVVIARDLWHQREQEDILRRALDEAEEAARSKTQFLATMAHEIRTPLNSVVGAARLALMEEDPEQTAEHLRLVTQASQMLLDLLNTVLDHSRLEHGSLPMEQMPVSLRQVLNQIGQQMAAGARAKGLQWSTRVDPSVPATVLGDSLRLRQVLTNLVGNAIKFTDNGWIEVAARVEPAQGDEQPAAICIEVADTGIGLTPEQQSRLFKAFSQADATIARRYGGTGLGLSISRQIMMAMGGSLSVRSQRGRGSTFFVRWPLRPGLASSTAPHEAWISGAVDPIGGECSGAQEGEADHGAASSGAEKSPGSDMGRLLVEAGRELVGRRVLVVDDNRMNLAVVRRLLERAGLQVMSATSGSEALECLAESSVDVVLLDLYMPEMNGDEVARRIRHDLGLHKLPVIALSASVTMEERERCAAAGMDDFVSKPIEPLELLAAMADCLAP